MTTLPAQRVFAGFVLHVLGGTLFLIYLLRFYLGPVDLFIHLRFLQGSLVQCAVAGLVYYSFSLSLLWRQPLSTAWGTAYAAVSLLLLVLVFTPNADFGAGMMRRVASPDPYAGFQRTMTTYRAAFRLVPGAIFLLVQAVFLRRFLRATAPPAQR